MKILLTVYGHLVVTSICINVAFDLVIGIFLKLALPAELFLQATTLLIDFTTPIVYGLPLAYSKVFLAKSDVDLLVEAKAKDSLLLANHGSRIDWMIAMFAGHLKKPFYERIESMPSRIRLRGLTPVHAFDW